MNIEVDKN